MSKALIDDLYNGLNTSDGKKVKEMFQNKLCEELYEIDGDLNTANTGIKARVSTLESQIADENKVKIYDNVSEMQSDSVNLLSDSITETLGYAIKGDKLGGKYIVKTNDDGTNLPCGTGLWFNKFYDENLNKGGYQKEAIDLNKKIIDSKYFVEEFITKKNTGNIPYGLCNDSNGNIYVVNNSSNSVTIFDKLGKFITNINVGSNPKYCCYDSNNNRVYVANDIGNSVSVINCSTFSIISTIGVGNRPQHIKFSKNKNKIYTSNITDGSISIIDCSTNNVTKTITGIINACSLCIDEKRNILYVGSDNGYLTKIDLNTELVTGTNITVGTNPRDLIYDICNDFIFSSNNGSSDISVINCKNSTVIKTLKLPFNPKGISYDIDNMELYIVSEDGYFMVLDTKKIKIKRSLSIDKSYQILFNEGYLYTLDFVNYKLNIYNKKSVNSEYFLRKINKKVDLVSMTNQLAGSSLILDENLDYINITNKIGLISNTWWANCYINLPYGICIGDSIAEGHPALHSRLDVPSVGYQADYKSQQGQPSWHIADMTGLPVYNHGIGGNTTTQLRNRWNRDVLAQDVVGLAPTRTINALHGLPTFVYLHIGVNDISQNVPNETIINNLNFFYQSCIANGVYLIIDNCGGANNLNAIQVSNAKEINKYMFENFTHPTVKVLDYFSYYHNEDGTFKAGMGSDDLHPYKRSYQSYINSKFTKEVINLPIFLKNLNVHSMFDLDETTTYKSPSVLRISNWESNKTLTDSTDVKNTIYKYDSSLIPKFKDKYYDINLRIEDKETDNAVALSKIYVSF